MPRSKNRKPTTVIWPGAPSSRDPWEDRFWATRPEAAPFAEVFTAWDAWRLGGPRAPFDEAARAHGLDGPLKPDPNEPLWGLPIPSVDDLLRMAADHWPAVGMDAPDSVLGPASIFAERALVRAAIAGAAYIRTPEQPYSTFRIWSTRAPIPTVEHRARLRAPGLAPWSLWSVEHAGDQLVLTDVVGLSAPNVPTGPVRLISELPVESAMAARVLRGPDGWVAMAVVPLDALPPKPLIWDWIRDAMWLARTSHPNIEVEALLRQRPLLVRRAVEWCVRSDR